MNIKKQLKRRVGKKTTRRIYKAMPWFGGAVAVLLGTTIASRGVQRTIEDVRDFGNGGRRETD